ICAVARFMFLLDLFHGAVSAIRTDRDRVNARWCWYRSCLFRWCLSGGYVARWHRGVAVIARQVG
ncbi:MAG: hypothetical protein ACK52S_08380, partial [Pirellula sp.]